MIYPLTFYDFDGIIILQNKTQTKLHFGGIEDEESIYRR